LLHRSSLMSRCRKTIQNSASPISRSPNAN
jgi:hypothetical protein